MSKVIVIGLFIVIVVFTGLRAANIGIEVVNKNSSVNSKLIDNIK